ncbi:hypothetical protein SLS57_011493 [Botryosphaeria dothidea]
MEDVSAGQDRPAIPQTPAQEAAQPAHQEQTEPTMRELMQMIQELRVENRILKNRQDQATGPDAAKKPSAQVKVPKPDLYHRERTKTQSFLMQLEDYLHFAKGQFGNDADKTQAIFSDYRTFAKQLQKAFNAINEAKPYVAGEYSDYTLRQLYYRGLKNKIKEAMSYHDEPETLPELIRLATDMDRRRTNRLRRERTTLEGGDAMALDAANRQDKKKDNKGRNNYNKKPKGPNPNWTDEQKKEGKQTLSAQREASVVSRQEDHDMLSWTACFNDDCQTHQSDKDATGWYPKKPRGLAMLTRNEEVLDLDDIIESFPHDDEIVNSKDGKFYDSTEAEEDSSDEKDLVEVEESSLAGAIDRLLEKVEEHGIIAKIPLHHGESEQGIWIPDNQPGLALVTWQVQKDQIWETRVYEDRYIETDEVTLEDNLATQRTLV